MDINAKKVEIIRQISMIQEPDIINEIDRFLGNLDIDLEDSYYKRKRFYEDGTAVDQKEEKPGLINEARRKIKGKLGFMK